MKLVRTFWGFLRHWGSLVTCARFGPHLSLLWEKAKIPWCTPLQIKLWLSMYCLFCFPVFCVNCFVCFLWCWEHNKTATNKPKTKKMYQLNKTYNWKGRRKKGQMSCYNNDIQRQHLQRPNIIFLIMASKYRSTFWRSGWKSFSFISF